MKVLLLIPQENTLEFFTLTRYLAKQHHIYKVYNYRTTKYYQKFSILNNIAKGILYQFTKEYDYQLIHLIDSFQPELIFVIKGEIYYPSFWSHIKKIYNCKIVNWYPDDPQLFHVSSKFIAPGYDLFFINPKYSLKLYHKYKIFNAHHIPVCYYNKNYYTPFLIKQKHLFKYDLLFVGNCYPSRIRILHTLKKYFSYMKIQLYGPRWNLASKIFGLHSIYNPNQLYFKDYFEEIQKTKIFINPPLTKEHINQKVFETISLKVFGIHGFMREAPEIFTENKEIVLYRNLKDLIEKVEYYHHNEKKRKEIIENAYKKATRLYTAERYIKEMALLIKNKLHLKF